MSFTSFPLHFMFETGRTVDPYFWILGYLVLFFYYGRFDVTYLESLPNELEVACAIVGLADVVLP